MTFIQPDISYEANPPYLVCAALITTSTMIHHHRRCWFVLMFRMII